MDTYSLARLISFLLKRHILGVKIVEIICFWIKIIWYVKTADNSQTVVILAINTVLDAIHV